MKIYIITEGLQSTGYGHITRCLAICQAFEELGYQPQMIVNGDDNAKLMSENQSSLFFNWLKHKEYLFEQIWNADIILIDSYLADVSLYKKIADLAKTSVYLDDNIRLKYPRGVVINGAIGAEKLPYPKSFKKKYLLGGKYQPIRKEFWKLSPRTIHNEIENIMVTMGGSDIRNLTSNILNVLNLEFSHLIKHVVIGNGYSNVTQIKKSENSKMKIYHNLNGEHMKQLMLKCDLAISAAGQTLYELAATQTPTIAIGIIDNQQINIDNFKQKGLIEYLGNWTTFSSQNLKESILKCYNIDYRNQIVKNCLKEIDNHSTLRLIEQLISINQNDNFILNE